MQNEDPAPGVPEWVVTFGDMMSLLLTFFIMLVSMSEVKEDEKYHAMVDSMRQEFGYQATILPMPGEVTPKNSNMIHTASAGRARRRDTLSGGAKVKAVIGENPRIETTRLGKHASNVGVIRFEEEGTELDESAKQRLEQVVAQIEGKPQRVEVRGHTSRRPLSPESTMRDKYELAYERCREVMQFLVAHGVEAERIHFRVAGEHEPAYEGVDADQQKVNDRVQVLLLDERVGTE